MGNENNEKIKKIKEQEGDLEEQKEENKINENKDNKNNIKPLNISKKIVIWCDDIKGEHEGYLKKNKKSLEDFDFIMAECVEKAIALLKKYKFKMIYVLISGSKSIDFFEQFYKEYKELNVVVLVIIFCGNKQKYIDFYTKKRDDPNQINNEDLYYLLPQKISISFDEVLAYLTEDECNFNNLGSIGIENYEFNEIKQDTNNYKIINLNNEKQILYPFLLKNQFNEIKIEEEEFNILRRIAYGFNDYQLNELIKPSREKNIFVPISLLSKFILRALRFKPNFTEKINSYLNICSNYGIIKGLIKLLYYGLFKGYFKSVYDSLLYYGCSFSKDEFDSLIKGYEKAFNNNEGENNNNNIVLLVNKSFLILRKSKEETIDFIKKKDFQPIKVLFIINPISNENAKKFVNNINISLYNQSNEDGDILTLPLSFFRITSIKVENEIKEIYLDYLDKYEDKINQLLKEENNNYKDMTNEEIEKNVFINIFSDNTFIEINNLLSDPIEGLLPKGNFKITKEEIKYNIFDFSKYIKMEKENEVVTFFLSKENSKEEYIVHAKSSMYFYELLVEISKAFPEFKSIEPIVEYNGKKINPSLTIKENGIKFLGKLIIKLKELSDEETAPPCTTETTLTADQALEDEKINFTVMTVDTKISLDFYEKSSFIFYGVLTKVFEEYPEIKEKDIKIIIAGTSFQINPLLSLRENNITNDSLIIINFS